MPKFVVVGHPNKGKSSLVATLAQNDQIGISALSGTTVKATHYAMQASGTLCYELVDTPGFQRAEALLAILREQADDAARRAEAITSWLAQNGDDFPDERALLAPVMDEDAALIYVVDGAKPYRSHYEAEMEILRWTGRPRLAIINPINGNRYAEQWRSALDQYFSLVVDFDPLQASFEQQLALLRNFATLKQSWQQPLAHAIDALQQQREDKVAAALNQLQSGLEELLNFRLSSPVGQQDEAAKQKLFTDYQHALLQHERALRERLQASLSHYHYQQPDEQMLLDSSELFDPKQWQLWGLPRKQLTWLAAGSGGAAGAMVDLGLSAGTFMLGAVVGSVASAGSVWLWGDKLAKVSNNNKQQQLTIGPVKNLAFSWVLLARQLYLIDSLLGRNHARRDVPNLEQLAQAQQQTRARLEALGQKEKLQISLWLQGRKVPGNQQKTLQILKTLLVYR